MRFRTITSPHILQDTSVGQVMRRVLYAMLPGIAALLWFFGWGVLLNLLLATTVALAAEALLLLARGKPLALYLGDYSAVVTAWLLAVALPPTSLNSKSTPSSATSAAQPMRRPPRDCEAMLRSK